jgi:hypothetical protein
MLFFPVAQSVPYNTRASTLHTPCTPGYNASVIISMYSNNYCPAGNVGRGMVCDSFILSGIYLLNL